MRADAVANRMRILAVAQDVFTDHGAGASTEEIARRAGVGIGTVFRHFPTKRDLVEAALVAHLDDLAAHAAELAAGSDPTAALHALLREMVRTGRSKMAMARHLLADGPDLPPAAAAASERVRSAVAGLLHAAQAGGSVRTDVDIDAVYFLLRGLSQAQDTVRVDDSARRRAIDVVLDGLAAPRPTRPRRAPTAGPGSLLRPSGAQSGRRTR